MLRRCFLIVEQCLEFFDTGLAQVLQHLPSFIMGGLIWRSQRSHRCSVPIAQHPRIKRLIFFLPLHRHAEQPPPPRVAHSMAANTGVIPVGNDKRAIGSHADIARAEPLVLHALHHVHDLCLVASPVGLRDVAAHDVRPSIAMDRLTFENLRQQVALIHLHSGR